MRTLPLSLIRAAVACVLVLTFGVSCDSPVKPAPVLATFGLTGVIRSSADQAPLDNATVRAVGINSSGSTIEMTATSDAEGRWTIFGLRDQVGITATRVGFLAASATIQLTHDSSVDLTLQKAPRTIPDGEELLIDQTVSGTFGPPNNICDPKWDAHAPCRQYGLTVPVRRIYRFILQPQNCDELELHVIRNDIRSLYQSAEGTIDQSVTLEAGIYEVRLMAYYQCARFELTVR